MVEWRSGIYGEGRRIDEEKCRAGRGPASARVPRFARFARGTGLTEASAPKKSSPWADLSKSLAGTLVIAIFVVAFTVQAFQIPSESMENTLLIGDYLLVDKLHFGGDDFWDKLVPYRPVRRGDIVVFHYPVDPSVHFVKRVVGVPGDKIRLIDKKV